MFFFYVSFVALLLVMCGFHFFFSLVNTFCDSNYEYVFISNVDEKKINDKLIGIPLEQNTSFLQTKGAHTSLGRENSTQ